MNNDKPNELAKDFREIKQDYAWDPSIFCNDEDRVRKLKEIIDTKLSLADKTIILLYTELQSYRKLGRRMGLSHMTCRKEVIRIRQIILQEYEHIH